MVQGGADAAVTVLCNTVNVAARLQALAEPGSAILSDVTHRLGPGIGGGEPRRRPSGEGQIGDTESLIASTRSAM